MSNPPKDGTLLLLLVKSNDENHPTEDDVAFRTIGFNNFENGGEDLWQCAGWDWCCDEFTETTGEIVGWMEIPEIPNNINH